MNNRKIIEFDLNKKRPIKEIFSLLNNEDNLIEIPYFLSSVRAGIPASVHDDYVEKTISVDRTLLKNPEHTFAVSVCGDSMEPFLFDGDIILVDKSQQIKPLNKIVVAWFDGCYTVKVLKINNNTLELVSLNKNYKPIKVNKMLDDFYVAGIVTKVMRDINGWVF